MVTNCGPDRVIYEVDEETDAGWCPLRAFYDKEEAIRWAQETPHAKYVVQMVQHPNGSVDENSFKTVWAKGW